MDYRDYKSYQGMNGDVRRRAPSKNNPKPLIYAMLALVVMLVIIIIIMLITLSLRPTFIARTVTVEAGRPGIYASDFLIDKNHTAEFAEDVVFDLSSVNEYKITLIVDGEKYTSTLIVVDTVPPQANVSDISIWQGSKADPLDCVSDIVDATEVEVSFKRSPDTNKLGKHEVVVVLKDQGGNTTEYKVLISVIDENGLLYTHYISELGDELPAADDFSGKPGVGAYISDISGIDPDATGIYMLQIEANGKIYDVILEIADTTPPRATVTPQTAYNRAPKASDFVSDIIDKSKVTVQYQTEPAVGGPGTYDVVILLTDAHGNQSSYNSYFVLVNDVEAPVIESYPTELKVDTGKPIIWRAAVKATDNSGEVELILDTSKANLDYPGVYTVEIIARDPGGNETRRSVKLTVNDGAITDEMLYNAIKSIEKDIGLTPDMPHDHVLYWVYRYVADSILYTGSSTHLDWRRETYVTLSGAFKGDCFTYAAVGYAILDYLGYDVFLIERAEWAQVDGKTHFWVLVNIGTETAPEWYHFDPTPWAAPFNLPTYLMTGAQIEAFTRWRNEIYHDNCYAYDVDKYPTVSTKILVDLPIPTQYFQ